MNFSSLGLSESLLRAVADQGYSTATPIQVAAIPAVLGGRDLLAAAQTGTGKTAAFTLPLLQLLSVGVSASTRQDSGPRALVLVPTRELASQVNDSVKAYGRHTGIRSTVLFGGVGMQPQIASLRRRPDIVIATPGRLIDLLSRRHLSLADVRFLVLDEADRMLDMGFIHDLKRILAVLPKTRQNLLFSATFSEEIRTLATSMLREPLSIEVATRNATAARVSQSIFRVTPTGKPEVLAHLLRRSPGWQTLVFTRTKQGANKLTEHLQRDGFSVAAIHGNKSQSARIQALQDFKSNQIQVLVATDIAARGLDIQQLPQVVNYELPFVAEDYVHRIGRTGRAGADGTALSLVASDELVRLKGIERLLGRNLPAQTLPEPVKQWGYSDTSAPRKVANQRRHASKRHGVGRGTQ